MSPRISDSLWRLAWRFSWEEPGEERCSSWRALMYSSSENCFPRFISPLRISCIGREGKHYKYVLKKKKSYRHIILPAEDGDNISVEPLVKVPIYEFLSLLSNPDPRLGMQPTQLLTFPFKLVSKWQMATWWETHTHTHSCMHACTQGNRGA